jgi:putative peptidoglycan lipid II flippase
MRPQLMSEHKAIFRSASAISVLTIVSRITGFVRDVLIAQIFGIGMAAQAFFVAFKIPNMFRDVMGEGAGNAAFVPVFCEYLAQKPRPDFLKLVNSVFRVLLVISSLIVVAGIILAPVVVRVIAPGFFQDRAKFDLTITLTRLMFPYLVLIVISAYLMAISNAHKSFAIPASTSIVSNLVLIVFIFLISRWTGLKQIYALTFAVLVAGLAQIVFQWPQMSRLGIDFRKGDVSPRAFHDPAIRKIGRLILPRLAGTSIYQLNIFVDTIFASLSFYAGEGAIAAIYYANRLIQFPFAVFGVALSNAALPTMSANSAEKEMEKFKATLTFCLKTVFLAIIPLTMAMLLFSYPLVRVIFQRGNFDAYSTDMTARAVFFYAVGLVAYVGVRFLSNAFYALQDTLTPVKTSSLGLFLNIVLNSLFIFVFRMQVAGLALASSISAIVNFYLLYRILTKRIGFRFGLEFGKMIVKIFTASFVMSILAFWIWQRWAAPHPTFIKMCLIACLGSVMYAGLLRILRVRELQALVAWLQKKQ